MIVEPLLTFAIVECHFNASRRGRLFSRSSNDKCCKSRKILNTRLLLSFTYAVNEMPSMLTALIEAHMDSQRQEMHLFDRWKYLPSCEVDSCEDVVIVDV